MVREKLRVIFSSKIFYIAFSILVSFALWMYVEINENQIQSIEVRDVPIVFLNKEILNDRGLFITSISPETITLTFECPRSAATKLTNSTLSAQIDLSGVTRRGSVPLRYEIIYPSGIDLNAITGPFKSVDRITLSIDEFSTKQIHIDAPYKGGVADGFLQDPVECIPTTVTVSGPSNVMSRIEAARVDINRENLSSTYTDDLPVILLDESGNELDRTLRGQLTLSDEKAHINIPIRMLKDVVLNVERIYTSGATEQNTIVTISPPTITVAGNPEDLRDYNSINLGTIDLTRFEFTATEAFQIVIPNNFTNITGTTEASVLVDIHGLELKYFSVSNIHTIFEPPGYTAEIVTQSVDVRIRGKAEDLADVTEANIRIVTNLNNLGPGTHRLLSTVHVDGIDANVGAVGNCYITVTIREE